jgi:hypothetical protein
METQPLTVRLKGHNTQVTEYPWFQLYMLHLVGSPLTHTYMAQAVSLEPS